MVYSTTLSVANIVCCRWRLNEKGKGGFGGKNAPIANISTKNPIWIGLGFNPGVLRQRPLINHLSHGTAHEWCGGRNRRLRDRRSSHSLNFNVPLPLVDLLLVLQQLLTASLRSSHQSTGSITWLMSTKLSSLCSWLASESENGVFSSRFWTCYCQYDPALTARHCVGWTTSVWSSSFTYVLQ